MIEARERADREVISVDDDELDDRPLRSKGASASSGSTSSVGSTAAHGDGRLRSHHPGETLFA